MSGDNRIYGLLPDLYRRLDSDNQFQLRALAELLDGKRAEVERDIARLYRDWFVETCDPAILPRLAELAGSAPPPAGAWNARALVADAVAMSRRKGTYPAAERILSDLSGWPVRVTPRAAGGARIEVWRTPVQPLERVEAAAGRGGDPWLAGCYRFHPLDVDCPLFTLPRPDGGPDSPFVPELDAPAELTRENDPARIAGSIGIWVEDGAEWRVLAPAEIAVGDLRRWAETAGEHREGRQAVVDPALGRLMLLDEARHGRRVRVSFGHGGAGDIGGGCYERPTGEPANSTWLARVHAAAPEAAADPPEGHAPLFRTLRDALRAWRSVPGDGIVRILDSATYDVEGMEIGGHGQVCPADPNRPRRLSIEAESGQVPTLLGRLQVHGAGAGIELELNGLWIDGQLALSGRVGARVAHCTAHAISPMRRQQIRHPAIRLSGPEGGRQTLCVEACLAGPIELSEGARLTVRDSVVDGYDGGAAIAGLAAATLQRATVLGGVELDRLDATDSAFGGPVEVRADDTATLSHCLVLAGPDGREDSAGVMGAAAAAVGFRSTDFGMPGYARLEGGESDDVGTGASNGSEIGAFNGERRRERERLVEDGLREVIPIGIRHEIAWR
jgi:hypothetical protein